MTCYFLLFWFILTLHDRTGRLENSACGLTNLCQLHDRTGRLENRPAVDITFSALHDRTGRLESIEH